MTIVPITPERPACFGVCCNLHGRCARYAAVEGRHHDTAPIVTCLDGAGEHPLFVELETEEAA